MHLLTLRISGHETDTWTCSDFQELKLTRKFQHHQGVVKGWKTAVTGEKWFYVWKPSHAMMAKLIPLVTLCTAPASRKDCVQPEARSEIGSLSSRNRKRPAVKEAESRFAEAKGLPMWILASFPVSLHCLPRLIFYRLERLGETGGGGGIHLLNCKQAG